MKQLIILAGGKGTRLKERLGDLPKPMIQIGGKPLLVHQIELAARYGFTEVIIFVCHRPDLIEAQLGDGSRWGVKIRYVVEQEPLGTAGAVLAGFDLLAERFAVLYGDTMVNVDLERIWKAHEASKSDATLLLHPNNNPLYSDMVEIDEHSRITAFHNRPHPKDQYFQNLVNAGLYVLAKRALEAFRGGILGQASRLSPRASRPLRSVQTSVSEAGETPAPLPLDFGKDLFPAMLRVGSHLHGYNSPDYIKDIGTHERYDRVCAEYESGVVQRSSLATSQRAVFLDRDGTLIVDKDCLRSVEELELISGVSEAVRELNHHGWRAVVVTNQPVIAKGWCTEAELQRIHNKLETLLGQDHAFLDRIYFCPHHPEAGFPGERRELKIRCDCRKPGIGLVQRAAAELNIDLKQSWLIGDTTTDVQTAKNAGLRSILVRTGAAGKDGNHQAKPDFVFDTLTEAVKFVLNNL